MRVFRVAWIVAGLLFCVRCGGQADKPGRHPDAADAFLAREVSHPDVASDVDILADGASHAAEQGEEADAEADDAPESVDQGDAAEADDAEIGDLAPFDLSGEAGTPQLLGAPLIVAPTSDGMTLNAVLRSGDPRALRARVRPDGDLAWTNLVQSAPRAPDLAEWQASGLDSGRRYQYQILAAQTSDADADQVLADQVLADQVLYEGSAMTRRPPGVSFTFDLLSDSHIEPCAELPPNQELCADLDDSLADDETTLLGVAADIVQDQPDFMIHLGDMLDYHRFGFNEPPMDTGWARLAYLNYRRSMGDALGMAGHFPTIGNWEGESGCSGADAIAISSSQRMLYLPGPTPQTYAEGGSPTEDYYAFTWGDALFVVLNVMTYTPTCHLLSGDPGLPDDWSLGAPQLAWLESTLAGATSKWRFLFIHHPVGGNAGDDSDSAYGRGGGRAAYVGEQAAIHQMMLKYGVQVFFYGHDHVFTDMVVDGIHYTLPGSAGAPWKFDGSLTGYTQYWTDSGHGRVTVTPRTLRVDFIASGGAILSTFSLN